MSQPQPPCSSPESNQFDFWLGDWKLTWPAEQTGGNPGERGEGRNSIEKMFGNCVVAENFEFAAGGYQGHSLSVYDARAETWRQTWVDSSGAYLSFTGKFDGQTMELRTEPFEYEGVTRVNRMVFKDIEPDSLRWEWQTSTDSGESWSDVWTIDYQRA